jgi:hypothetical protein
VACSSLLRIMQEAVTRSGLTLQIGSFSVVTPLTCL